jgi:hypothetical protein
MGLLEKKNVQTFRGFSPCQIPGGGEGCVQEQ